MWDFLFTAVALLELGVTALFRWRTWRDRGIILLLCMAFAVALLWTEPARDVYRTIHTFVMFPGYTVLLPALWLLLGLSGLQPLPWVLFACFAYSYDEPDFTWLMAMPILAGQAPWTIFRLLTMPGKGRYPGAGASRKQGGSASSDTSSPGTWGPG